LPQRCQISVTKHETNVGWITDSPLRTKRGYFDGTVMSSARLFPEQHYFW